MEELRLPAGAVTGVGSLPHTDPAAAAAYVLERSPDLPAIPSLPRRSPHETMLGQAVVGVRGVQVTADGTLDVDPRRMDAAAKVSPDLDHDAFGGLRAFLSAARGRTLPVKWQFTGPVTLGLALARQGVPTAMAFDVAIRAVRVHLRALHKAVAEAMPLAHQVVVLDEPGMTAVLCPGFPVAPDSAIDLVSGALAAVEATATAGVHCCGEGDWAALLATGPGLASMPVSTELVRVAGYLAAFLERGGWVAWGAVPTDRPVGTSGDRYWRELTDLWCQLVNAGCDPIRLRRQAIVTPACGLGLHDLSQADRVLKLTSEVGERVGTQASATRIVLGA